MLADYIRSDVACLTFEAIPAFIAPQQPVSTVHCGTIFLYATQPNMLTGSLANSLNRCVPTAHGSSVRRANCQSPTPQPIAEQLLCGEWRVSSMNFLVVAVM